MKRLALSALAALVLTACQVPLDFAEEPVDFIRLDAKGTPPVVGKNYLAIRTYIPVADGEPVEIGGAACTARSSQFRADFQTPVRLGMPQTKGAPKPLKLTCRANGKSAELDLPPVQLISGVGVNTGELLSSVVATVIVGGATMEASRAANIWGYRYEGETVMGIRNEMIVLRLLLQ